MYVKTGDVFKVGIDVNVYFKIFGEKGDIGLLKLENAEFIFNKFERNRIDYFIFYVEDIGKVCYIYIEYYVVLLYVYKIIVIDLLGFLFILFCNYNVIYE